MPYVDPEIQRAYQRAWTNQRRKLRALKLTPPPRKVGPAAVLDPDDYAHPSSDVRLGA